MLQSYHRAGAAPTVMSFGSLAIISNNNSFCAVDGGLSFCGVSVTCASATLSNTPLPVPQLLLSCPLLVLLLLLLLVLVVMLRSSRPRPRPLSSGETGSQGALTPADWATCPFRSLRQCPSLLRLVDGCT